jgi:hypothetical protein
VPAHAEIPHVIEEDDSRSAARIHGFAQQGSHHHVGTSRLIYDCGSKIVMMAAKASQALGQRATPEIWAAANY